MCNSVKIKENPLKTVAGLNSFLTITLELRPRLPFVRLCILNKLFLNSDDRRP